MLACKIESCTLLAHAVGDYCKEETNATRKCPNMQQRGADIAIRNAITPRRLQSQ